jgi:hypothetical protein
MRLPLLYENVAELSSSLKLLAMIKSLVEMIVWLAGQRAGPNGALPREVRWTAVWFTPCVAYSLLDRSPQSGP